MELKEALRLISNKVYQAATFAEDVEHQGLIFGNGHHVAQDIAAYAQAKILLQWRDRKEALAFVQFNTAWWLEGRDRVIVQLQSDVLATTGKEPVSS